MSYLQNIKRKEVEINFYNLITGCKNKVQKDKNKIF